MLCCLISTSPAHPLNLLQLGFCSQSLPGEGFLAISRSEHQMSALTVSLFFILLSSLKAGHGPAGYTVSTLSPHYLSSLHGPLSLSLFCDLLKVWALLRFPWPFRSTLRSTSPAPMVPTITLASLSPTWTPPPECQSQVSSSVLN